MPRLMNIPVSKYVHDWIQRRGIKGETFDGLLRRLLEIPEEGLEHEGTEDKR